MTLVSSAVAVVEAKNSPSLNFTALDCGIRHLALEYYQQQIRWRRMDSKIIFENGEDDDVFHQIEDALRMQELCPQLHRHEKKKKEDSSKLDEESAILEHRSLSRRRLLQKSCRNEQNCIYVTATTPSVEKEKDGDPEEEENCSHYHHNPLSNEATLDPRSYPSEGKRQHHHHRCCSSIHDAIQMARRIRDRSMLNGTSLRENGDDESAILESRSHIRILLGAGIHSLQGKPIQLSGPLDSDISFHAMPNSGQQPKSWLSGGVAIDRNLFSLVNTDDTGLYVANATDVLRQSGFPLPLPVTILPSLFTNTRRYIRARYPNADPEINQWGYSSPHRLDYSLSSETVLEWHRPPASTPPNFTFYDFRDHPPPNVPYKNDSAQEGYNWYASGKGGACSDVWGDHADSYWCSNASQGGWSEVDRECAMTGQMGLPIGMTYNSSDIPGRWNGMNLTGGIVHAWHSQSWATHMFEITGNNQDSEMTFAKGGGRQGGRNWCRCDQCTYAAGWCGQHQTPAWEDTRLISGTWMVENVAAELDQPGEYYFDKEHLLLYVRPNATSDLDEFRLAILDNLVDIRNATNVTFEGIGFRDTSPTYMADDWSAPSGGDWSLHRGGAVFLENVDGASIAECHFWRLDGNAIFLSRRTRDVMILNNRFEWLGENAVATWGDTDDFDGTEGRFPMNTVIEGNVMRELGIFEKQSSGIGQCKAALTQIRYNVIFNTPRAAINFNDMLGGGDVVEGNLIFNTCRESGDHGPINSWDRQAFLTTLASDDDNEPTFVPLMRSIGRNFIFANYGASEGVDNDDGSSWYHIHDNVFYAADGFKMDYGGHDSVFENNLVMALTSGGNECYNMGGFLPNHQDTVKGNRCLVGLQEQQHQQHSKDRWSQWQDPADDTSSTLRHLRRDDEQSVRTDKNSTTSVTNDSDLIGRLWAGCNPRNVVVPVLQDNHYFTPTGTASIGCGGGEEATVPLQDLQRLYAPVEESSTVSMLPVSEQTILRWVKDVLWVE